ncbi:MAG: hypothetical protein ACRCTR_03255 [Actinomycetota bacterium]
MHLLRDEIGLAGGVDPDCRRPFPWDETAWDHNLLGHYRRMITLRRKYTALHQGAFIPLTADGDVYAYGRGRGKSSIVTVLPAAIVAEWRANSSSLIRRAAAARTNYRLA